MKITRNVRNSTIIYSNELFQIHRTNGPATIWFEGDITWRERGNIHRIGKCAVMGSDYFPEFYENDILTKRD